MWTDWSTTQKVVALVLVALVLWGLWLIIGGLGATGHATIGGLTYPQIVS